MKNFFAKISVVTLSLSFIFLGSSVARAQLWVAPTGIPPLDNTPAPVNVGPLDQEKSGWLGTNNFFGNKRAGSARVTANAFCLDQGTDSSLIKNWTKRSNVKYNFLNGTALPTDNYSLTDPSIGVLDCISAWPTGGANIPGDADFDTLYWDATAGAWVNNNGDQGLRTNGTNVRVGSLDYDNGGAPLFGDVQGGVYSTTPGVLDTIRFAVAGNSAFRGDTYFVDGDVMIDQQLDVKGNTRIAANQASKAAVGQQVPGGFKFTVDGSSGFNGFTKFLNGGTEFSGGAVKINSSAPLTIDDSTSNTGVTGTVLTNTGNGLAQWLPAQGGMNPNPQPTGPVIPAGESHGETLWWDNNAQVWTNTDALASDGTRVRVGTMPLTSFPTAKFGVNGYSVFNGGAFYQGFVAIVDGSEGQGKVLTSDASGIASWQTPVAGPGTTVGETAYWDGTKWLPNINIKNDGNKVAVNGDLFVPGGQNEAEFQINAEGDSMGNDWWGTGQGWGHPLALQGYGQRLMAGVDTSRQNAYFQSVKQSTNGNSVSAIALNPQGGNVRVGSIDQTTGIPGNTNDTFGVTGNSLFRGSITIQDGSQSAGNVLTSDANGLASWQPGFALPTGVSGQTLVWNSTLNNGSGGWEAGSLGAAIPMGTSNGQTLRWDTQNWIIADNQTSGGINVRNDGTTFSITRTIEAPLVPGGNFDQMISGNAILDATKISGSQNGPTKMGLIVDRAGNVISKGLHYVIGSLSVEGGDTTLKTDTQIGSDSVTGSKSLNLFGKLKVKVFGNGTIAEFLGAGDVKIKQGSNSGQVTIGYGSNSGVPLHVVGTIFADDAGYTSGTNWAYNNQGDITCKTQTITGFTVVGGFPQWETDGNPAPQVSEFQLSDYQGGPCASLGITSNTIIKENNTNNTCVTSNIQVGQYVDGSCTAGVYDADNGAPNFVYELHAEPRPSDQWVYNSSNQTYNIPFDFKAMKFAKVDASTAGGNFIGRGAKLSSLVSGGGDRKTCSDTDGWLKLCDVQNTPPLRSTPPVPTDLVTVLSNSTEHIVGVSATAEQLCPVDYVAIGGGGSCWPDDEGERSNITENNRFTSSPTQSGWRVSCAATIQGPQDFITFTPVLRPGPQVGASVSVICMRNDLLSH